MFSLKQNTFTQYQGQDVVIKYQQEKEKYGHFQREIENYEKISNHLQLQYFTAKYFGNGCKKGNEKKPRKYMIIQYAGLSVNKITSLTLNSAREASFTLILAILNLNGYKIYHNVTIQLLKKKVVIELTLKGIKKYVLLGTCCSKLIDFGLSDQVDTECYTDKDLKCAGKTVQIILGKIDRTNLDKNESQLISSFSRSITKVGIENVLEHEFFNPLYVNGESTTSNGTYDSWKIALNIV